MINLTEQQIKTLAPDVSTYSNAKFLATDGSLIRCFRSEDNTVIFGECTGSGNRNYHPSVDFRGADQPVAACDCPSRLKPCKHSVALMLAYECGAPFEVADIPVSILDQRVKAKKKGKRKKTAAAAKPKKVNKAALKKKIKAQLDGLELLEKVLNDIVKRGIGAMDKPAIKELEAQAKQLGNFYLPGARFALLDLTELFKKSKNHDEISTAAMDYLSRAYGLCKKGKSYLQERLENEDMPRDTGSEIEAWLGYAWQLTELKEAGLIQEEVDLIELSFSSGFDHVRKEFVDEGIWLNLESGQLVKRLTLRPKRAKQHVAEVDSFHKVAHVDALVLYPGAVNPRVRWEAMTP